VPAKRPKKTEAPDRERKTNAATRAIKDWAALVLRSRESPSLAPRKERQEPER
jgi:hypothetical protein